MTRQECPLLAGSTGRIWRGGAPGLTHLAGGRLLPLASLNSPPPALLSQQVCTVRSKPLWTERRVSISRPKPNTAVNNLLNKGLAGMGAGSARKGGAAGSLWAAPIPHRVLANPWDRQAVCPALLWTQCLWLDKDRAAEDPWKV